MSIIIIFGSMFAVAGIAESIQKEIHYARKRKAWNERRYNMKHRVIA